MGTVVRRSSPGLCTATNKKRKLEAGTHTTAKTHVGENPVASGCGEVTQGKPSVSDIACAAGITAGKTQRSLRTQRQRQYCVLSEDDTDIVM